MVARHRTSRAVTPGPFSARLAGTGTVKLHVLAQVDHQVRTRQLAGIGCGGDPRRPGGRERRSRWRPGQNTTGRRLGLPAIGPLRSMEPRFVSTPIHLLHGRAGGEPVGAGTQAVT